MKEKKIRGAYASPIYSTRPKVRSNRKKNTSHPTTYSTSGRSFSSGCNCGKQYKTK
ncbi:hypothetical protein [Alkalihalobacillus deserti]|uniref:hypothetical protein n=1 Tax=Alkalihalobacillus deserti TaxID=2879466 RepID=UPI001D148B52|nr:hypothetical protein [Alkalihalobacillus deserti]